MRTPPPKGQGDFQHAPIGLHQAICCDMVDLGNVAVTFNGETKIKHMVRICFLIEERKEDGKPYYIAKKFPFSMHQKAGLRKFLGSWRGKAYGDQEANEGVELEDWVGKQAQLSIQEITFADKSKGSVIDAILQPGRNAPVLQGLIREAEYTRVQDRPKEDGEGSRGTSARADTPQFSSNQGQRAPAQRQPAPYREQDHKELTDDSEPPF